MPLPPLVSTTISLTTPPRLQVARYVRDGLVPHAAFESDLAAAVNFIGAVRNKELFRWRAPIASIPSSNGSTDRIRWRFAAHTGPLLDYLRITFLVALQDAGDPIFSPKARLVITNKTGSTTYGTAVFQFGANATTPDDFPVEFGFGEVTLHGIPADTDIYGRLEDDDAGRLIAVSVAERSLDVSNANGYVVPSQVAATGPIYDARRENLYELGATLWKSGAAHLLNWTVDDQASPRTNASATAKNILDLGTSGDAGPRWSLDTTYCGTSARSTTVPCVLAIYAKMSGASDTGEVTLQAVAGSLSGNTISVSGSTAQWYTLALDLPAALDEYYIEFANPDFGSGGETISMYAANLYQFSS